MYNRKHQHLSQRLSEGVLKVKQPQFCCQSNFLSRNKLKTEKKNMLFHFLTPPPSPWVKSIVAVNQEVTHERRMINGHKIKTEADIKRSGLCPFALTSRGWIRAPQLVSFVWASWMCRRAVRNFQSDIVVWATSRVFRMSHSNLRKRIKHSTRNTLTWASKNWRKPYLFLQKKFISVFYAINIFNTISYFKPCIKTVR